MPADVIWLPGAKRAVGPRYTPIAHMKRRRDKPRRTPIGIPLDLNKLFYMALTPEARVLLDALALDERLNITVTSMDALRETTYAKAMTVSLVKNSDTGEITVACEWEAPDGP